MGAHDQKVILNLGCGFRPMVGAINVDAYEICKPDVLWDLNKVPWPWEDKSVDTIYAIHFMEHLDDWMAGFLEVTRILKTGGVFEMHVPDHTSTESSGYIDHHFVFTKYSFHLCVDAEFRGTNAWARSEKRIPMKMTRYERVIFDQYIKWWIPKWFLKFAANHLVNFVHEQRFTFIKTA